MEAVMNNVNNSKFGRICIRGFVYLWQGVCLIIALALRLIGLANGLFSWFIRVGLGIIIFLCSIGVLYLAFVQKDSNWIFIAILLGAAAGLRAIHYKLCDWCYDGAAYIFDYIAYLQDNYRLKREFFKLRDEYLNPQIEKNSASDNDNQEEVITVKLENIETVE